VSASTWVAIIVPLIGFLGTVATIVASRKQERAAATKTSAEALQVIQASTLNLLDPLQKRVEQMAAENTSLRADVDQMRVELGTVKDDRDTLASAIRTHVAWEDKGRPDPPGAPTIGARVRTILNRLHTTA